MGTGVSAEPPCAFITSFDYEGEFDGTLTDSVTYDGPITIEFEADEDFYEGPDGTHGQDVGCDDTNGGVHIDVSGTATGTNSSGDSVSCFFQGNSEYWRIGNLDVFAELLGLCDITVGSTTVNDSRTQVDITGTLGTCTGEIPPPPDTCESSDTYTASNI